MKKAFLSVLVISILLAAPFAESRVGGGRTFGSRGSRGFSAPYSAPRGNTPFRPYEAPSRAQPIPQQPFPSSPQPAYRSSSFLKSLGAGIAGGFLGSMLYRSLGGGYAHGFNGSAPGGIGILEILLIGGLLFLLFRLLTSRSQQASPRVESQSSSDGAAVLMRQAKPYGWSGSTSNDSQFGMVSDGTPIQPDLAMDLFFQIQGAWANRDLTSADSILDSDVKSYLNQEIARLKANRQINRLENIAVRSVDVVESWRESDKNYSTVRINANLLDFTIQEDTQQIVDGSKTAPVKFEEYWTFSKDSYSSQWKLSAIQQS